MSFKDRMQKIIDDTNLPQAGFAKLIKVDPSYISKLLSDKTSFCPSDRIIDSICDKRNVNKEWLLYGNGTPYLDIPENDLVAKAATLLGERDPLFEALVETYSNLNTTNRKVFLDFGTDLIENLSNKMKKE